MLAPSAGCACNGNCNFAPSLGENRPASRRLSKKQSASRKKTASPKNAGSPSTRDKTVPARLRDHHARTLCDLSVEDVEAELKRIEAAKLSKAKAGRAKKNLRDRVLYALTEAEDADAVASGAARPCGACIGMGESRLLSSRPPLNVFFRRTLSSMLISFCWRNFVHSER